MSETTAPEPTPLLEVRGLTKRYGSTVALDDVSFAFAPGEIHALCGHNGAGKSTLVQLIAGTLSPDAGMLRLNGEAVAFPDAREARRAGIALVQQELSIVPTLSVQENVLLGGRNETFLPRRSTHRARVGRLLATVGLPELDPAASAASLSPGEQQLVEIARGLERDARLLILDEPTATLSDVEIERVFDVIRRVAAEGATVVFVSHRLGEVLRLCDRVTVLRDGHRIATQPVAGLSREALIEQMIGSPQHHTIIEPTQRRAERGLEVCVCDLWIPGRLDRFSLHVRGGEVVALAGQVGAGTSEALRAIAGLVPRAHGEVRIGSRRLALGDPHRAARAGVRFVSNDRKREGLFLVHSAAANLVATRLPTLARAGFIGTWAARRAARALAAQVAFDGGRLDQEVETFSGGNQQKLFVGRVLDHPVPGLVLLDEPTRGVDVGGRAEIHDVVRRAAADGNAVVFASTELDEILELADSVITMYGGQIVEQRARSEVTAASVLAQITHAPQRSVAA